MTLQYQTDGEFTANERYNARQLDSEVIGLNDGRIAYVWKSQDTNLDDGGVESYSGDGDGEAIKAIIRNADGSVSVSEFIVNSSSSDNQSQPAITQLENGRIVFTWLTNETDIAEGGDGAITAIKAKVYNANGTVFRDEFVVNSSAASQQDNPNVTALADGGFVMTWRTFANGGQSDVAARIYGANGLPVGNEFAIQTNSTDSQDVPDITALKNGGFAVSWASEATPGDADGTGVAVSVFDKNGNMAAAGEVAANTGTTGAQDEPRITALANGKFVVAWETTDAVTTSNGIDVAGRIFNADGTPATAELQFNATTVGDQTAPVVSALENGWFVVIWESGNNVIGQVFDDNGVAQGDEFQVNTLTSGQQVEPDVATMSDGQIVISWTTRDATGTSDNSQFAIESAVIDIFNQQTGDGTQNTINGVAIKDVIDGLGGADTLRGLGGDDVLNGDAGNDKLFGGGGSDTLNGDAGKDVLNGGGASDIMRGGSGNDLLIGSNGNDRLFGDTGRDVLNGGNGRDIMKGGVGNDKLFGDRGNDKLTGQGGRDHFGFSKRDGRDTITDFRDRQDKIDLKGFNFKTKQQALNHFKEIGGQNNDKVGFHSNGTHIVINGVDLKDISGSDILI